MTDREIRISPDPPEPDREAILAAVREILRREEALARPAPWRVAGWTSQRAGITDFGGGLPADRRWTLSARLPWGGREYPGLQGRGDAK